MTKVHSSVKRKHRGWLVVSSPFTVLNQLTLPMATMSSSLIFCKNACNKIKRWSQSSIDGYRCGLFYIRDGDDEVTMPAKPDLASTIPQAGQQLPNHLCKDRRYKERSTRQTRVVPEEAVCISSAQPYLPKTDCGACQDMACGGGFAEAWPCTWSANLIM